MGNFTIDCTIDNPTHRARSQQVRGVLAETGSELTWISGMVLAELGIAREKKDLAFMMANGQQITRSVGFVIVRLGEHFTIDEVVFGEPGDLPLLGARTLKSLNLTVDLHRRRLIAAGPMTAARVTLRHWRSGCAVGRASGFPVAREVPGDPSLICEVDDSKPISNHDPPGCPNEHGFGRPESFRHAPAHAFDRVCGPRASPAGSLDPTRPRMDRSSDRQVEFEPVETER